MSPPYIGGRQRAVVFTERLGALSRWLVGALVVVEFVCLAPGLELRCQRFSWEDAIPERRNKLLKEVNGMMQSLNWTTFPETTPILQTTLRGKLACYMRSLIDIQNLTSMRNRSMTLPVTPRRSSCAVVSNSGVMKNHRHGPDIDAASAVFRFNDAPTAGWEEYVGRKEDMRFVNMQFPERVARFGYGAQLKRNVTYVDVLWGMNFLRTKNAKAYERLHQAHPELDIYTIGDARLRDAVAKGMHNVFAASWFHGHPHRKRDWPTTGALGLLLSMEMCDEVLAYGFALSKGAHLSPYHYYDTDGTTADTNTVHQLFDAEKALWRLLSLSSQASIDETDLAVIPGFSTYNCDP